MINNEETKSYSLVWRLMLLLAFGSQNDGCPEVQGDENIAQYKEYPSVIAKCIATIEGIKGPDSAPKHHRPCENPTQLKQAIHTDECGPAHGEHFPLGR